MNIRTPALLATDPLGFLAAVGLLRVLDRAAPGTRLAWVELGGWTPMYDCPIDLDPTEAVMQEVERWRRGHAAVDFARGADNKIQDLKHPPSEFRALMRSVRHDDEASAFITAFATGVAIDGGGQTKPTSFHFTAGQQQFLDAVLSVLDVVDESAVAEALQGPWVGTTDARDTRWRAGSQRSRALLSYDPGDSKNKTRTISGAVWLAFLGLPLFPTTPLGLRIKTTGFSGRGRTESFCWPVWQASLLLTEVRLLLGLPGLSDMDLDQRKRRGIAGVFCAKVLRSSQGYGNFSAAFPR